MLGPRCGMQYSVDLNLTEINKPHFFSNQLGNRNYRTFSLLGLNQKSHCSDEKRRPHADHLVLVWTCTRAEVMKFQKPAQIFQLSKSCKS